MEGEVLRISDFPKVTFESTGIERAEGAQRFRVRQPDKRRDLMVRERRLRIHRASIRPLVLRRAEKGKRLHDPDVHNRNVEQ
jgi:hypothetical protein